MTRRSLPYFLILSILFGMSLLPIYRADAAWRTRNGNDYIDIKKVCTDGMVLSFAVLVGRDFTDSLIITLGAVRKELHQAPVFPEDTYRGSFFGPVLAPPRPVELHYNPTTLGSGGMSMVTHLAEDIVISWEERLTPGTIVGLTFMYWLNSGFRTGPFGPPEYVIFPSGETTLASTALVADVMYGVDGDVAVSPDCSIHSTKLPIGSEASSASPYQRTSTRIDIVDAPEGSRSLTSAVYSNATNYTTTVTATTFYVGNPTDSLSDEDLDILPGDGVCSTVTSTCTLRAAIQEATALPEAAIIVLPAGIFRLMRASADGNQKSPDIDDLNVNYGNTFKELSITGAGTDRTNIDGNWISRVLNIAANQKVTISNVTIRKGFAGTTSVRAVQQGGAIFIARNGTLILQDSSITGNIALGNGGAIYNAGDLTLINVRFSHNSAGGAGNDVYNIGTLHIVNTTYIPLIAVSPPAPAPSPDLIIVGAPQVLPATPQAGQPTEVRVIIKNAGTADVVSPFWVDLYVDPSEVPQPNRIWPDISPYGAAWRVYGLRAGDTITLSTRQPDDPHDPASRYSNFTTFVRSGAHQLYALVDSFSEGQPMGAVDETDEQNNLSELMVVTVRDGGVLTGSAAPHVVLDARPAR
jgi:hypothetical protein